MWKKQCFPTVISDTVMLFFWKMKNEKPSLDSKFNFSPKKGPGFPLGVTDPGQDKILFYHTINKGLKRKTMKTIKSITNLGMTPPHHFQLKNNAISLMVGQVLPKTPSPIRKWNLNALFSIKENIQKCKSKLKYFLTPWSDHSL